VYLRTEYKNSELFTLGFDQLVGTPWTSIENAHRNFMGDDVFTTLVYVKALLDEQCCIVAAEPPAMQHTSSCRDCEGCAEDWRAIWWNGMGRLLLDVRNPQPFEEAFQCFQCLEFGRVGEDCKRGMLTQVMAINVPALHVQNFIDNVCGRLIKKLKLQ